MARVSTTFTLLVLSMGVALLLMPRDRAADRRASFAVSGVDPMSTGATGPAARAKYVRDTLAP